MEIRCFSSLYLNINKGEKNKALRIVEALEGKKLSKKETDKFENTDGLIGKKCYLTVEHYTAEDGKTKAKVEMFEPASAEEKLL